MCSIALEQKLNRKEIVMTPPVSVAEKFVDLALRPEVWNDAVQLPETDVAVLFETVTAAGFEPKAVVPGKLRGNYRDQDGSSTGETYPINSLCQYKVTAEDGDDNWFATGWLDCAVRRAVYGITRKGENREQVIEALRQEIEKSVPLQPVQLTADGDMLLEYPKQAAFFGGLEYFVSHTRDADALSSCVGVHKHCHGWVDRNRATDTHDSLVCRRCHMRVLFPTEVKTYGQLREALAAKWTPVTA